MKKLITIVFFITITTAIYSQVNKPPYPIIFVHGWAGSDTTWKKQGTSWVDLFEGYNWTNGGTINICLDTNTSTLHDAANEDVAILNANSITAGDFYFVNFHVNRGDTIYPKLSFVFDSFINTTDTFHLDSIYLASHPFGKYHINPGDILVFESDAPEYIRVLNANYTDALYQVQRGIFNSTPLTSPNGLGQSLKNHSNLSYQSSIVKGALGIKNAINLVRNLTDCENVILVCHSMGGLNAREFIQTNPINHHVALLVTFSTPHLGSNKSDFNAFGVQYKDYDIQSDAVRDLRTSLDDDLINYDPPDWPYGNDPDDATFLFGGYEDDTAWSSIFNWYSRDFDGDGIESSDSIKGLNEKNWPPDVLLHCIIGRRYIGVPGFSVATNSDGVVRIDRQYPWPDDIVPSYLLETNTIKLYDSFNPFYIAHFRTHKQIDKVLIGLDEPDTRKYAYQIDINQPDTFYNGFITQQSTTMPFDMDNYKFISDKTGIACLEVNNIFNENSWHIFVYDDTIGSAIAEMANPTYYTSDGATIYFDVELDSTYFIEIYSLDVEGSYLNPYSFRVSTSFYPASLDVIASLSSMPVFDIVEITVTVLDSDNNPVTNTPITLTSNNTGLFLNPNGICHPIGEAITSSNGIANTDYLPTAPGSHTITATANVNNVTGQLATPISVEDSNLVKIINYEYWFNGITSNIQFGSFVPAKDLHLQDNINIDSLATGLHTLNIRFKDFNGLYSQTITQYFYKTEEQYLDGKISFYEYWYDNDTMNRVSQYVYPSDHYQLLRNFDCSHLSKGLHIFHVRFFDVNGKSSQVISNYFYKRSTNNLSYLTRYEYWFDSDYAGKIQSSISPASETILIEDFSTNSLTNGLHTFNIRFADTNSLWSNTICHYFYKYELPPAGGNLITAYRYWFDEQIDHAVEKTVAPPVSQKDLFTYIIIDGLSHGSHYFSIQFMDTLEMWSSAITQSFNYDSAIYIWDGEVDNLWNNQVNWNKDLVPDSIHTVVVPNTLNQPILNSDQKVNKLNIYPGGEVIIDPGYILTVRDSLMLHRGDSVTSKIIVKGTLKLRNE